MRRPLLRALWITFGTVVILAIGLYVPATLLAPLPAARASVISTGGATEATADPVLPVSGASAITSGPDGTFRSSSGDQEAVPMAAMAKVITALVVLDRFPMDATENGRTRTITPEDYQDYIRYSNDGARTVVVFAGETWTQREMMQAMILGSSNNHADTLARWAFGSVDSYLDAAADWSRAHDLATVQLADTTGLSEDSRGSASDLAAVAALAMATPAIATILADPVTTLAGSRGVSNTTTFLDDDGFTGISRSYTDEAGVCFLFSLTTTSGDLTYTVYGATMGLDDYDQLEEGMTALAESARAGILERSVVSDGQAFGRYTTAWGATADALASRSRTSLSWGDADVAVDVELDDVTTAPAGALVGRVTPVGSDEPIALRLSTRLADPGPAWRLLNPIPVITELIDSWSSSVEPSPTPPVG